MKISKHNNNNNQKRGPKTNKQILVFAAADNKRMGKWVEKTSN